MKLPFLFAPLVLFMPLQVLAAQTDAPDCIAPITPVSSIARSIWLQWR